MYKVFNSKQLTKNSCMRLGSHIEQQLVFSLVHLILDRAARELSKGKRYVEPS